MKLMHLGLSQLQCNIIGTLELALFLSQEVMRFTMYSLYTWYIALTGQDHILAVCISNWLLVTHALNVSLYVHLQNDHELVPVCLHPISSSPISPTQSKKLLFAYSLKSDICASKLCQSDIRSRLVFVK